MARRLYYTVVLAIFFFFVAVAFVPSWCRLATRSRQREPYTTMPATTAHLRHTRTATTLTGVSATMPTKTTASTLSYGYLAKDFSIVLTWVNGSDTNYMKHREIDCVKFHTAERGYQRGMCDSHWRLARVRTMGEIVYNLRSIEKHLPWFQGTIFLVMDDWAQPPSFFDFDETTKLAKNFGKEFAASPGPPLRLMRHSEFIPKALLPTYSAYAIIPHLHRIPGITELFAHFEDDLIVGRPLPPEELVARPPSLSPRLAFERNTITKSWCKSKKKKGIWLASMCFTVDAFLYLHPNLVSSRQYYIKHAPMVYNKTVLGHIVDDTSVAPPGMALSLRQKFRSAPTIQTDSVYAWHMMAGGGATAKYAAIGHNDDMRLLMLNDRTGIKKLASELARFRNPKKVPSYLTINDDGWTLCEIGRQTLQMLDEVLPEPSRWEWRQERDMAGVLMRDMNKHHQCRRRGEKPWKNLT
jgi:hypothetical protein